MRKFMLQLLILLAIVLAAMLFSQEAPAEGLVSHVYVGGNGVWQDGPSSTVPQALEAGGSASSSISPHLSAVGETFFGLSQSYARWSAGARATVTDALNPDFNAYLGVRYRGASVAALGVREWAPDAGFGWRLFPKQLPRLLVGGDAGYGLTSNQLLLTAGIRWEIPLK